MLAVHITPYGISQMETLSKHFRSLTAAAFRYHGFAQADVLARWPEVVGKAIAAVARPERIRWSRAAPGPQLQGGTLHVKAMAGRGLEVQQMVPLIIERINRFLGYGAIMAVKIQQGHELAREGTARPAPPPLAEAPKGIVEPELAAALQRLGGGVHGRSPQDK